MSLSTRLKAYGLRIIYILLYPLAVYVLHKAPRARVVVIAQKQVLLQRSSMGSQRWNLPGGGIQKYEAAKLAAVREVLEETGIKLLPNKLRDLGLRRLPHGKHWPMVDVHFFAASLSVTQAPEISHKLEVLEAKWFLLNDLPKKRSKTVDIGLALASK